MKKTIILIALLLSVTCVISKADINTVAPAVTPDTAAAPAVVPDTTYFLTIAAYFAVPQADISAVRQQGITDEGIPVVFFLARQAKVAPAAIMELRLKSQTWQQITMSYGYGAEIYYVPVEPNAEVAPLYSHAYGYYKEKPRKEWGNLYLQDDEIINLVNLKILSEHFNSPSNAIMTMRQQDKKFYTINDDLEKQKQAALNPDHATGSKKQLRKANKFFKKIF